MRCSNDVFIAATAAALPALTPVRDAEGKVIAAINIATPEASPEAKDLATRIKDAVVETAETISQWLGPKRPRPATRRAGSAAE